MDPIMQRVARRRAEEETRLAALLPVADATSADRSVPDRPPEPDHGNLRISSDDFEIAFPDGQDAVPAFVADFLDDFDGRLVVAAPGMSALLRDVVLRTGRREGPVVVVVPEDGVRLTLVGRLARLRFAAATSVSTERNRSPAG